MNPLTETQPIAAAADQETILFVLTPKEQELFLPHAEVDRISGHDCIHANPETLNPARWEELLRERRPTVLVSAWNTPAVPISWIESGDMSLRYLCHITGSVRGVAPRALFSRDVRITNWGSTIIHTVAEHAVLMVLALLRGAPAWPAAAVSGKYTVELMPVLRTRSLRGKRVGLHGFGAVAREIVALLKPFQVDFIACSQGVPRSLFEEHGVEPCDTLDSLFSRSDVLIECESLTPQTQGSVTAHILNRLPHDAVFVNVGRAQVVDEAALIRIASEKRLRIGLDVYHQEPLSPNSPLAAIPGLLLSPHIAGPTGDTFSCCGDHALENLRRYLNNEPLSGLVTAEIYDRST